jgi:DNA-binding MurR/RpiR family transcriptional regulator
VVVVISHSGFTTDSLEAAQLARSRGVSVIAISKYGRSPLQRLAHVTLHTMSPGTTYRSEGITSLMAQLALIDTLMVNVYQRKQPTSAEHLKRTREALKTKRL